MPGIKHLVECHCYLAIYKKSSKIINHKFPVYSKLDDDGKIIAKNVKCNNCEALHRVYDVCKSEFKAGKDQSLVTLTIDDLMAMMPQNISNFLVSNNVDISTWEHVKDIIDEKRWGEPVIIKRDIIDEKQQIKYIELDSKLTIKINLETLEDTFILR